MKNSIRFVRTVVAALYVAGVLSLTGCGRTGDDSEHADTEVRYEISEAEPKSTEVQTDADTVQTQDDTQEQGWGTGSIMRAYSDGEKERMAELIQSYQNETLKPEKMIQEVDSAESVTEGTLCYIRSTGEYYLPDRELTDEELLEIIDCNFRIAVNSQGWTREKIDEADWRDRAVLEEKVKAAGGINEDEAIEIAEKAMETDIGDRSGRMELHIDYRGWSYFLWDITNWREYKDRGEIAYFFQFDDTEDGWYSYHCVVNAMDGSILDAYGLTLSENAGDDDIVYYTH